MLIFDSGLMHGNKINTENKTRLSFDFSHPQPITEIDLGKIENIANKTFVDKVLDLDSISAKDSIIDKANQLSAMDKK